jgi:WD40 repeat protein
MAIDRNTGHAVTGAANGTIRIWDAADGRCMSTFGGAPEPSSDLYGNAGGKETAGKSSEEKASIWNIIAGQQSRILCTAENHAVGAHFSPDGGQIIGAWSDKMVVWDAASGREIKKVECSHAEILGMCSALAHDGTRIAIGCFATTIRICNAHNGRELLLLKGPRPCPGIGDLPSEEEMSGIVMSVALSPDNKYVASVQLDNTVRLWDTSTGTQIRTFQESTQTVTGPCCVVFSPDGRLLANGGADGVVRLWSVRTGKVVQTFVGHQEAVNGVAFSTDGKRIVAGSNDQTVRVWDATTGCAIHTLQGHASEVVGVTFSPDGQRIASASVDGMLKLWDSATGQETLSLSNVRTRTLTFSPTGTQILIVSEDTVSVLDATAPPH